LREVAKVRLARLSLFIIQINYLPTGVSLMAKRFTIQKRARMKVLREAFLGVRKRFERPDRFGCEKLHPRGCTTPMPDPKINTTELIVTFLASGGKVVRGACEGIMPRLSYGVTGKGQRQAFTKTYGNGTRKWSSAVG
jgi:hypothetical protein